MLRRLQESICVQLSPTAKRSMEDLSLSPEEIAVIIRVDEMVSLRELSTLLRWDIEQLLQVVYDLVQEELLVMFKRHDYVKLEPYHPNTAEFSEMRRIVKSTSKSSSSLRASMAPKKGKNGSRSHESPSSSSLRAARSQEARKASKKKTPKTPRRGLPIRKTPRDFKKSDSSSSSSLRSSTLKRRPTLHTPVHTGQPSEMGASISKTLPSFKATFPPPGRSNPPSKEHPSREDHARLSSTFDAIQPGINIVHPPEAQQNQPAEPTLQVRSPLQAQNTFDTSKQPIFDVDPPPQHPEHQTQEDLRAADHEEQMKQTAQQPRRRMAEASFEFLLPEEQNQKNHPYPANHVPSFHNLTGAQPRVPRVKTYTPLQFTSQEDGSIRPRHQTLNRAFKGLLEQSDPLHDSGRERRNTEAIVAQHSATRPPPSRRDHNDSRYLNEVPPDKHYQHPNPKNKKNLK